MGTTLIIIAASLALLLAAWIGVPWAYLRWLRRRARRRCRRDGTLFLTFDDGPSDAMSQRILDRLARHDLPATHFIVTAKLPGREQHIRAMLRAGHCVGCHGDHHVNHWKSAPWAGVRDILACWRAVADVIDGAPHRLPFRPPYGKLNLLSLLFLLSHRTPIAQWTLDSDDTAPERRGSLDDFRRRIDQQGGGILLLHDYDRDDANENDFVIDAIDAVAAMAPPLRIMKPDDATFA